MQALQPSESEAGELRDHVIIAGFGRVGQIIAQLLSERLIPFVALDVRADRVQVIRLNRNQLWHADTAWPPAGVTSRLQHGGLAGLRITSTARLRGAMGVQGMLRARQAGKELDLPVYFGDAGSPAVLHSVGGHRAKCAVITLDTPGANYRTVWALNKVRTPASRMQRVLQGLLTPHSKCTAAANSGLKRLANRKMVWVRMMCVLTH